MMKRRLRSCQPYWRVKVWWYGLNWCLKNTNHTDKWQRRLLPACLVSLTNFHKRTKLPGKYLSMSWNNYNVRTTKQALPNDTDTQEMQCFTIAMRWIICSDIVQPQENGVDNHDTYIPKDSYLGNDNGVFQRGGNAL